MRRFPLMQTTTLQGLLFWCCMSCPLRESLGHAPYPSTTICSTTRGSGRAQVQASANWGTLAMEGVHSYEQRSTSELGHELYQAQNRMIIVNRREPHLSWSAQNQVAKNSTGLTDWFRKIFCSCPQWSECSFLGRQSTAHGLDARSSSSLMGPTNYDLGPFASNEWRTSKYTLITFLPKNLFEQFRRLANFYFLFTAILQIVVPYSPVGPLTSLLPLMFVVFTSAVKQAYEDYLRHKLDKEVNNRPCQVLRDKKLVRIRAKDIMVGDFVKVRNNEELPCDMLLVAASGHGDRCYITTANLDGESSLKSRTCYQIKEQLGSIEKLDTLLLIVECESPNATLYEFNGYLRAPKNDKFYDNLVATLNGSKKTESAIKQDQQTLTIPQIILNKIKISRTKLFPSTAKSSASKRKSSTLEAKSSSSLLDNLSEFYEIPLDISNLLLRASRLRNTNHIYGLAIYTGRDTKLAHNSHVKPNKFSSTESKVNIFLILALMMLLTLSLIGAILYCRPEYWFIKGLQKADSFGQIFVAHFLVYNYLMPISLYVTLEFIKFFGTLSVIDDKKMKVAVWQSIGTNDNSLKTVRKSPDKSSSNSTASRKVKVVENPKCNSSDLNEELGQVEVLFSDKTGTLTENKMLFMACSTYGQLYRSVGQHLYLQPPELYQAEIPKVAERLAKVQSGRHMLLTSGGSNVSTQSDSSDTNAKKPFDHRHIPPLDKLKLVTHIDQHERVVEFFICLCLCSTITLNEITPLSECLPDQTLNDYDYQSASPDEESLITAAHLYGVSMCKSNDQECYIVIKRSRQGTKNQKSLKGSKANSFRPLVEGKNSTEKYIVRHFKRLQVFEFNSVRKRMSAIYRDCDNDCIVMVSKGSEELLDCVKFDQLDARSENSIDITLSHFEAFAMSGLRTLLVARRIVTKEEYEQIEALMKEARQSIQNRDHLLRKLYHKAEIELRLIGATAVEDTLQEGVPETIANLKEAGIKVWLLTGDKVETAISVAYLCRLLDRDMTLFHLVRQQDVHSCQKLLSTFDDQLDMTGVESPRVGIKTVKTKGGSQRLNSKPQTIGKERRFALIADGRSLYYAMKYARGDLARICKYCVCVLGCRLSPLQKAEVVDMLKKSESQPITAAIGDGANDVSMIQEAHVGIGVSGKEGKQAVNSSDFAISRFHMLNRLLFVHGHLFYHRTANVIHYFFYKNLLFIMPQFLYSFYNLSSAHSLYHPILLICFNLVFTSLPILIYGLYEIHIPERLLEHHPKLYKINKGNQQMRLRVFLEWLALGGLQGALGFFTLRYIWGSHTPLLESGKMMGVYGYSLILYFAIIMTATIKLSFLSRYHSSWFNISAIVSVLMMPVLFYTYSMIDWAFIIEDNSLYGQAQVYLLSPMFWLAVFCTTLTTMIPDVILYVRHRINNFREINSYIDYPLQEYGT